MGPSAAGFANGSYLVIYTTNSIYFLLVGCSLYESLKVGKYPIDR